MEEQGVARFHFHVNDRFPFEQGVDAFHVGAGLVAAWAMSILYAFRSWDYGIDLRLTAVVLGLHLPLVLPPVVMGFGVARIHEQLMLEAGGQADADYEIEGRLERGLFVSRSYTTLRIRGDAAEEGVEIALRHEIVHGPVPVGELLFGAPLVSKPLTR